MNNPAEIATETEIAFRPLDAARYTPRQNGENYVDAK